MGIAKQISGLEPDTMVPVQKLSSAKVMMKSWQDASYHDTKDNFTHRISILQRRRYQRQFRQPIDPKAVWTFSPPVADKTIWSLNVPSEGVRLDDYHCGMVLRFFVRGRLYQNWPGEFDRNGMLRATRHPLGNLYEIWIHEGATDVKGRMATVVDVHVGWFYGLYMGLQPLTDEEGGKANYMKCLLGERELKDVNWFRLDIQRILLGWSKRSRILII